REGPLPSQRLKEKMVGTAGFEPATPCTPSKCATRLRHVPTEEEPLGVCCEGRHPHFTLPLLPRWLAITWASHGRRAHQASLSLRHLPSRPTYRRAAQSGRAPASAGTAFSGPHHAAGAARRTGHPRGNPPKAV